MKRKIAILGSTGSIGKTLLKILQNDKKNFEIVLISGNKNYKELLKQSKIFKVKNLILSDDKSYQKLKKKNLKSINIYNNFNSLENILKNKIDYVMSAITGIDGLEPTLKIIKHTKKIAIANKESIICGWHLIKKEINKFNVSFIPVDSEHFSIFYALRGINISKIEKIYLTASGGPIQNFIQI
jgi:1-deoxy-D-xylulose-5-phosphate reductoisomerase